MQQNTFSIMNFHGLETQPGEYQWDEEETPYVVSVTSFEKQLEALLKLGFDSLKLKDLNESTTFDKRFMITFDDGLRSDYEHAFPLLKQRGIHAIFFISAALVDKSRYMSWSQLSEILDQGFEIGSHGLNHVSLLSLSDRKLKDEIYGSKQILEDKLGAAITSFSVPRGFHSQKIEEYALAAGYQYLFTSNFDVNRSPLNLLALNRLVVKKDTTLDQFIRFTEGKIGLRKNWESFKSRVRGIMPSSLYDTLAYVKRQVRK